MVLLWTLEVPVYDLVLVEVVHPGGDLFGPLHQLLGRNILAYRESPSILTQPLTSKQAEIMVVFYKVCSTTKYKTNINTIYWKELGYFCKRRDKKK